MLKQRHKSLLRNIISFLLGRVIDPYADDYMRRKDFPLCKSLKRPSKCRLDESRCVVYRWRMDYNLYRPHSDLDYMYPTSFAMMCHQQSGGAFCFTKDREIKREIFSE